MKKMYKCCFIIYNGVMEVCKNLTHPVKNAGNWGTDMIEKQRDRQSNSNSLESILIESIHTLVYEKDINVALDCFLETICKYYKADRAYIFEFNLEEQITDNTFEWCAEGIREQKDKLQNVPMDVLDSWMEKFQETGEFYIAALEQDISHSRADFSILKAQGIDSLMAAPLLRDDEIVGFLGVDNPAKHIGDMTLLRSVVDFVTADLEKRRLIEALRHAGCIDMLTGLKNRNEYMLRFNELKRVSPSTLGVVFIDINGLKQLNDTYGHERGDGVIRETAECIQKHFKDYAYRIGGDEFIVLWDNVEEEVFDKKVAQLREEFVGSREYSISMGYIWQRGDIDIGKQVKKADIYMYRAKQAHYQNGNNDRRKRK